MAQERMRLPSGSGGLTRYFEDYRSNVQISPGHVIALTIIVTIIILLLHQFGPSLG
jgi:preprotein translocase subunit Sec61beta